MNKSFIAELARVFTMPDAAPLHIHIHVITQVVPQVDALRLRGRISLNFSTTYAVDCGV